MHDELDKTFVFLFEFKNITSKMGVTDVTP